VQPNVGAVGVNETDRNLELRRRVMAPRLNANDIVPANFRARLRSNQPSQRLVDFVGKRILYDAVTPPDANPSCPLERVAAEPTV
jgi:hypothetical protein